MAEWATWIARRLGLQGAGAADLAAPRGESVSALFEDLPHELRAYFDNIAGGSFAGAGQADINLLTWDQAAQSTWALQGHPLVAALDGIALDDPGTSDRHLYVRAPSLYGSVFFLSHDGNSRIVFSSLETFMEAARCAHQQGHGICDEHPACTPLAQDQAVLSEFMHTLLGSPRPDGPDVAMSLIPSWDLSDSLLLEQLATHDDFLVSEALADEITLRPAAHLLPAARFCSEHSHPQASEAGVRAVRAVLAQGERSD